MDSFYNQLLQYDFIIYEIYFQHTKLKSMIGGHKAINDIIIIIFIIFVSMKVLIKIQYDRPTLEIYYFLRQYQSDLPLYLKGI